MTTICTHLDQVTDVGPGKDVCETCAITGGTWLHLRQCLVCGLTGCCDTSEHKHASGHFRETGHPLMRTLETGQTWWYCFVDAATLEADNGGSRRVVDAFFAAGLWFAREELEAGRSLPFEPGSTAPDGFPISVWETTVRGRHRAGALDADQVADVEALPGWSW